MLGFAGLPTTQPAQKKPDSIKPVAWLENAIKAISPQWAAKREQARQILAYYEAARPSTTRKIKREVGSGDVATLRAGDSLRAQARHLEQNHDLARGIRQILITNIVGANGITVEPQPRNKDGTINSELATRIRVLLKNWERSPEVTQMFRWAACQRQVCGAWIRDGEILAQIINGTVQGLDHRSKVPFSLELLEADYLPFFLNSSSEPWITEGVERNQWGAPIAYHLFKTHPGDWQMFWGMSIQLGNASFRRVEAGRILHVKICDRARQARGVSVYASIIGRLDDIKDYEESERIAAKIAASMAAFIKKGRSDDYSEKVDPATGRPVPRHIKFQPGMVFDDLEPGEEIGMIDTNRPNTSLEAHRNGQLRAASSGAGISYSSWSKDYDGNYSARRQELVDSYANYAVIQDDFCTQFVAPVYENFVKMALLAGLLNINRQTDLDRLDDALFIGPQMPWIDPSKEASAWETLQNNIHASGPEIIRRRGQDPESVLEQATAWRDKLKERDLIPIPSEGIKPVNIAPGTDPIEDNS